MPFKVFNFWNFYRCLFFPENKFSTYYHIYIILSIIFLIPGNISVGEKIQTSNKLKSIIFQIILKSFYLHLPMINFSVLKFYPTLVPGFFLTLDTIYLYLVLQGFLFLSSSLFDSSSTIKLPLE